MTTQSPHLYARQPRSAAARPGRAASGRDHTGTRDPGRGSAGTGVQTSLPWWAVALPAVAFATLLALLTGGAAHASSAASSGDWAGRFLMMLPDLVHHLL
ncbi:hypothetical protein [Streptomyces sp. HPF1205]|uniref:hypothetical protein n=1 Tax=Streptomyces sp. HPF1205 TaxID=2873262 RepID=UPI001CED6BE1|nr:hypothetical protein [Streptomyces sp. HPF1205]